MSNPLSAKVHLDEPAYRDKEHVISVYETAVLSYSSNAPNPRYLEAWARIVERVAEEFQGGLLALIIIDGRAPPPDDASKTAIRNVVVGHANQIDAFAYVVEGEGFRTAAIRSGLSLISLAARYPFPQKVFGRLEEAVPWMLSRPPRKQSSRRPLDQAELLGLATSLRSQLPSAVVAIG